MASTRTQATVGGAMMLLDEKNVVLEEMVTSKFLAEKRELCDSKLCDFDDVEYRVFISPEDKDNMTVSATLQCWNDIKDNGATDMLDQHFGEWLSSGDGDISLKFNLDAGKDRAKEIGEKVGKLRTYLVSAPFVKCFNALRTGASPVQPFSFALRPDTNIYFVPSKDRVVAVFGLEFKEYTDVLIARVFANSFMEARRNRALGRAPIVSFSPSAPAELSSFDIPEELPKNHVGFVSFAVLMGHVDSEQKMYKVASSLSGFRDYMQYHIKCSKAYFHSRMRARVKNLLQVLNRAKADKETEKKTASGRTFVRK